MPSATKVSSAVTSRYALALIELATQLNKMEKVEQDLDAMRAMIAASPELAQVVHSPSLSRKKQESAVGALAEKTKFDPLTKNFLGVLVHNRRLYAFEAITEAVKAELSRRRGEIAVEVKTAQDLSPEQIKALQKAISQSVGREISLKAKVEPSILGGLIVTVGSKMIDDSVAHKLERLKAAMSRQSNQNVNENTKEVG